MARNHLQTFADDRSQLNNVENAVVIASSLLKQQNVFSSLQSIFAVVKSYIKSAYRLYLVMNPEWKFGQCMVKLVYTRYPGFMRLFRAQNISLLSRRLYFILTKYMSNIINGNVFAWYGSQTDQMRVGSKVAAITTENNIVSSAVYNQKIQQKQPSNFYDIHSPYYELYKQRFGRQASHSPNIQHKQQQPNGHKMPGSVQMSNEMFDSDARIDLSNHKLEREAEELFNIDKMFWKSLGIEENSIKRYSLAYCGKEYATDALKRFVKNVLLS